MSSWFGCWSAGGPVACSNSFYIAFASALSTWPTHTFIHWITRNLGYPACFHQAPPRLCLAKQEGSKGSHFTAWHGGMGRVLQAHCTSVRSTLAHSAHHELGSSLPPSSHSPFFFHLVPPRTWCFGFPVPWRAARGLHLQAQSWLRAQRSSVGGA